MVVTYLSNGVWAVTMTITKPATTIMAMTMAIAIVRLYEHGTHHCITTTTTKEVATQIAKNCRRQQPHSHLRKAREYPHAPYTSRN